MTDVRNLLLSSLCKLRLVRILMESWHALKNLISFEYFALGYLAFPKESVAARESEFVYGLR